MRKRSCCPACSSLQIKHCYDKDGYKIFRCGFCSSMFVYDIPSSQELESIYSTKNYYELSQESTNRNRCEALRRIESLKRYKSKGSYFEIGCAKGVQLDIAKNYGYKTSGIELSQENVEICIRNGHDVIRGFLEDSVSRVPAKGYDVISCLDVIEHVENPIDFLSQAIAMLSTSGIMIVSTPNYSGLTAKLLGRKDPYMTPPEHLNFFTSKGMRIIFQLCGARELKKISFGTLTVDERSRVVTKYFPPKLSLLGHMLTPIIPLSTRILNILKVGMEQEFYLTKEKIS